jgi:hypothetical protein
MTAAPQLHEWGIIQTFKRLCPVRPLSLEAVDETIRTVETDWGSELDGLETLYWLVSFTVKPLMRYGLTIR